MIWHILIPIVTCLGGAVGGFFIAAHYMKKQFTAMQTDPKQIQMLAESFGRKLNQKQLNNLTRQMKKNKKPS